LPPTHPTLDVLELFSCALDRASAERDGWLAEACAGNTDALLRVRRMLAAHAGSGVLDRPVRLPVTAAESSRIGQRFGPYRILEEIGRGGMGVVYKSFDERLGRHAALKFVTGRSAESHDGRRRLLREARAASQLDSPNICTVYDIGEGPDGQLFIAMAYYDGETLASRISRSLPTIEECERVAAGVAAALVCAHESGIIHRDIKPSNIILTSRGEVKVLDFGIAKAHAANEQAADNRVGTLLYAAPEQLRGELVDARADIWSLGVVLYEMLTGRCPFERPTLQEALDAVQRGEVEALRALRPDTPARLDRLVSKALDPDREARFGSAVEMLAAMRPIARESETSPEASIPVPLTTFVGRDRELAHLRELVASTRLVTLTGPAGAGKTRLAMELGLSIAGTFADGARFVSLAAARDEEAVLETIADALAIPTSGNRSPRDCVVAGLAGKNLFLILDNFEQAIGAAETVSYLLERARGVTVLVTSRIALRLTGEQEYNVPPLEVPSPEGLPAGSRPAVLQLFEDRARAVRRDFEITGQNRAAVLEICARVDGLPLAIELAAARTNVVPPELLAARLGSRLDLLRSGARDRPTRHQTLRQALAWSHDLLTDTEKRLFRRCAAFTRTFSLEALEEVCASFEDKSELVLDTLGALIDHSLVMRHDAASAEPRFYLLETMREFAGECLELAGERKTAMSAQVARMARLAGRVDAALTGGAEQAAWIRQFEAEHDDLRAVLDYLEAGGEIEAGLDMCARVWRFWMAGGHLRSGLDRMRRLLALAPDDMPVTSKARALTACGALAQGACAMQLSRELLEPALVLYRQLSDAGGEAAVLNHLAWIDLELGEFGQGRARSEKALQLYEVVGDSRGKAVAHNNLAWIENFSSRFEAAVSHHARSIELRRLAGDRRGVAFGLINLAWTEQRYGRHDRALQNLAAATVILQEIRDVRLEAWATQIGALVRYELGDNAAAAGFSSANDVWRRVGQGTALAYGLAWYARCLLDRGQVAEAGAAIAECEQAIAVLFQPWSFGQLRHVRALALSARGQVQEAKEEMRGAISAFRALDDRRTVAECLESLARISWSGGNIEGARACLTEADRLRMEVGAPAPPVYRGQLDAIRGSRG
jgi:non-specific serine/threonine protein kinase